MISVCIPIKNDFDIEDVLYNLYSGHRESDLEIILVNDGSKQNNTRFRPLNPTKEFSLRTQRYLRVINNPVGYGVGYSFDRAVEKSRGDIIVLMGADVYVKKGWYDQVTDAVSKYPNSLNGVCCLGLKPDKMDMEDPSRFKRYGAELLFTVSEDDLPKDSPLRGIKNYSELFKAKWLHHKQYDEPYEIPCILGAFYFTTKEYYNLLGGWDTMAGNRFRGHKNWGSLEPYISLKSWLVGGGCVLHPNIEAGHVFSRYDRMNKGQGGVRGEDVRYWNQLFILETQILDERLRQKLYSFLKPRLNINVARKWIKEHYKEVEIVREANRQKFINTPSIFTEKFGYKFKV